MKIINSKKNEVALKLKKLKDKKYRNEYQLYLVEGRKMVFEALHMGAKVDTVFFSEDEPLINENLSCEAFIVSREIIESVSDAVSPQGCLAAVSLPLCNVEKPTGTCLVLDGVSDPGNLGTIIRTAAAVNVKDIYLVNSADPFSPKTVRSSMSGIFSVKLHIGSHENVYEVIKGLPIIVADMSGENCFNAKIEGDFALVLGSEAHGVGEFFTQKATKTVKIPMQGRIESLNVGVSAAVLLYEFLKADLSY